MKIENPNRGIDREFQKGDTIKKASDLAETLLVPLCDGKISICRASVCLYRFKAHII